MIAAARTGAPARLRCRWERLVDQALQPRSLIAASVFRLAAGAVVLFQYLINYEQRHYLFGPSGVFPWEVFHASVAGFSLYALSPSPLLFEILFHLGVAIAILWTAGWRTRWLTPLNYVFWWSLHARNPVLWDGGDNLMQLLFVYACFADVSACFSLDAARRARRALPRSPRPLSALLHNAALFAFAIQVSLVYGIAGLTKVQGETWRNGTALYYALHAGQFDVTGWSNVLFQNAALLTLLAYWTVFFQISFPFLLCINRGTRLFAIATAMMFHLGIAFFMGLVTFAGFMMAADLALLSDDEYRLIARAAQRLSSATRRAFGSAHPKPEAQEESA
jgi:hypothetical protein